MKRFRKLAATLLSTSVLLSMVAGCSKNNETSPRTKKTELTSNETSLTVTERNNGKTPIFELAAQHPGQTMSQEELNKAYSTFIFELMKHCSESADGKNVLISADSVLLALEMTAAGADGNTLDQMLQTMVPNADHASAFQFAVDRMHSLQNDSLQIANSIWINQADSHSVYEDYLNYVERHFDASISVIPFDDQAVNTINNWVADKTKERITKLLDQLDSDSLMVLINAMAFDGKWQQTYEDSKVREHDFRNGNGETTTTDFLFSTESIYLHNADATGFIKEYDDGKYAFMTILPNDENVDINTFVANMSADDYWEFWDSMETDCKVYTRMPEFESEYDIQLNEVLKTMGMEDAFNEARADFSNMSLDPVYISKVIHKTYINVNREGTEAAAATAVVMEKGEIAAPEISYNVYCDRPFAYAIVDMDTGLPVFLGTVETV